MGECAIIKFSIILMLPLLLFMVCVSTQGGKDDKEFFKYIQNSIMPHWPDACDIPGKRVMINIDCGQGRLNPNFFAECHVHGFVLFLGVPNSTTVRQYRNKNQCPFKLILWTDLNKFISLQPWIFVVLIFGETDSETNWIVIDN